MSDRELSAMEYIERVALAVRRQQRKHTLSKKQSRAIVAEVCPFCEHYGVCDQITDISSDGHVRQICKLRSSQLDTVWLEIGEIDRPNVKLGDKFGRLTVEEYGGYDNHGNPRWVCRCDCGNSIVVRGANLLDGNTTTCGSYLRHKKDEESVTISGASTVNSVDNKKHRYTRGSIINPDGSRHKFAPEHSSRVGCSVELVVKEVDKGRSGTVKKYYTRALCGFCGKGIIRYDDHGDRVCENCSAVH